VVEEVQQIQEALVEVHKQVDLVEVEHGDLVVQQETELQEPRVKEMMEETGVHRDQIMVAVVAVELVLLHQIWVHLVNQQLLVEQD
jgi:hypothetical protein